MLIHPGKLDWRQGGRHLLAALGTLHTGSISTDASMDVRRPITRLGSRLRSGIGLAGALLATLVLSSGCVVAPKIISADFTTAPPLKADSLVVPGTMLSIEQLTLTDANGNSSIVRDPTQYDVQVSGGSYDPATRQIRLSADDSEALTRYTIIVTLTSSPEIQAVKHWFPDFARIRGPEPEDVTSFDAKLVWKGGEKLYEISEGTLLLPGEEYYLRVTVQDPMGRTFASDRTDYPIPDARLRTRLEHLFTVGNDPIRLKLTEAASQLNNDVLIEVSYVANSRLTKTLRFASDPQIAHGPDAALVASVEIVGDLQQEALLGPGARKTLDVRVTDINGRSWVHSRKKWSHLVNEYPLPPERINVDIGNGIYDPETRTISFESNANIMLKETFTVTVNYDNRPALLDRKVYQPDFLSIVPLMEEDELAYVGPAGRDGGDGRNGQSGRSGRNNSQPFGRAGDGRPGGHATSGQNGRHGESGPNLRVVALEVRTKDAATRLMLLEVRESGSRAEYFVRRLDALATTVISRGGSGGKGGNGGTGGNGGSGGNGYYSGDGGNGGNGGSGGTGGDGGIGGDITVVLVDSELEGRFVLDSQGGPGGSGGAGGTGGLPGEPGSIATWAEKEKDKNNRSPPEIGTFGNEGNIGQVGLDGQNGRSGNTRFTFDERAVEMVHRAPDELRNVLLFY